MDGHDRRRNRLGYFEHTGVHDAHLAALGALGDRKLKRAKRKIGGGQSPGSRGRFLVGLQRSGNLGLKDEQLLLGQLLQSLLRDAEVLGQHVLGRVRHPIGEQDGGVLGKVAVVENQQELSAVGIQSLNRVRNSRGEIPKIVFLYVGDEALAVGVDRGDSRASIQHERPLRGGVPMEFAHAAGGEPHVHAGHGLGDLEFAYRHLARPSALVQPLVTEGEWIFERRHSARIRWRRIVGIGILRVQQRVCGAGGAFAIARLCGLSPAPRPRPQDPTPAAATAPELTSKKARRENFPSFCLSAIASPPRDGCMPALDV